MSRTVMIELSDEEYALIEREAEVTGRTPDDVIATTLHRHASLLALITPKVESVEEPVQESGPITAAEVDRALRSAVERLAPGTGKSPDELLADFRARIRADPPATLTEEERQASWKRLEAFFGSFDSGDPHSADNERIDADLAREYGRGLTWDE